jgi:hypothetical protein
MNILLPLLLTGAVNDGSESVGIYAGAATRHQITAASPANDRGETRSTDAAPVVHEDLVLAQHGSPGTNPSTKFSFVTRYTSELQLISTMRTYPLLSHSPMAAVMRGDVLFVSEERCDFGGQNCSPRIVRYDANGHSAEIGPPLRTAPRVLRLTGGGELIAVREDEVLRFDAESGNLLAETPFATALDSLYDADVDAEGGCSLVVTSALGQLSIGNLCEAEVRLQDFPADGSLYGVRFLEGGELLATGKGFVARIGSDGSILRRYDVGPVATMFGPVDAGPCRLAVLNSRIAVLGCSSYLRRLDLESGDLRDQKVDGDTYSINAHELTPPRRRTVRH